MKAALIFLPFLMFSLAASRAGVLPPHATLFDKTLAEYSAEWWIYNYSLPPINPDPAFPPAGPLNHPSVYFLQGSAQHPVPAGVVRTFTVPEGVYVFFPIVTGEAENIDTFPPLTVEELRQLLADHFALASEIRASIDGVALDLTDLAGRREVSPVFSYFFEEANNLKTLYYGHDIVGLVDPVVADGYYVMLEPLPLGLHALTVGYEFGPPVNIDIETPFNINVVTHGEFFRREVHKLIEQINRSTVSEHSKRPLISTLEAASASLDRDRLPAGLNQLGAFQNKVRAQVGRSDQQLAEDLIERAQQIMDRATRELP
jgi:hypothetical protein